MPGRRLSAAPRPSQFAVKAEVRCASAVAEWAALDDPADVDDAVTSFVPTSQPQRDETLRILAKLLDVKAAEGEDDLLGAVVSGATLRLVRRENECRPSFAAFSKRLTVDDAHELVKLVLVGDAGVGKSCLMIRFVRDEFVSSTKSTVGMDFCARQLAVDALRASENSVVEHATVQVTTRTCECQCAVSPSPGSLHRAGVGHRGPGAVPLSIDHVLPEGRRRDGGVRREQPALLRFRPVVD